MQSKFLSKGFSLVELLVVLALVAILSAILYTLINPVHILKNNRDAQRLHDMDSLRSAILSLLEDNQAPSEYVLCRNLTPPCPGTSGDIGANVLKNNGEGWVKIDFSADPSITYHTLPADPLNSGSFTYQYISDGQTFELNAFLESDKYKPKMADDGGDNPNAYEVGTSLKLLH